MDYVQTYEIELGYKVFYIRGRFVESDVDFHYYGGYDKNGYMYDIYHLPIATYLDLTRYECDSSGLRVYGILDSESEHIEAVEEMIIRYNRKQ